MTTSACRKIEAGLREAIDVSKGLTLPGRVHIAAWAALGADGFPIVNSVRSSQDEVRLAAGECSPVRVLIIAQGDDIERALAWERGQGMRR